ncbi:MAG: single-stranded DNA-binding protein [Candidatus Pacebacteria bacterium]|nr:single-stranded DNA-binding protein [Candidatus Paceibacterota bacterium]
MNLNKVFVLGNLTADPISRALPSGQSVVNFGLATNRIFYDKDRQKQQQAEFHNIVAFGRIAEIAQQYLKKGSMVLIEGRIQTRSWQDSSGNKRTRTEIITEKLQLGPRTAGKVIPTEEKEAPLEEIPIIEEGGEKDEEINVSDLPF